MGKIGYSLFKISETVVTSTTVAVVGYVVQLTGPAVLNMTRNFVINMDLYKESTEKERRKFNIVLGINNEDISQYKGYKG